MKFLGILALLATLLSGSRMNFNGVRREYFPDGTLKREITYVNGQKHGTHRAYFRTGQKRLEGNYSLGVHDGPYMEFYRSGKIYSYSLYKKNRIVGYKLWRENGRIYSNYVYKKGERVGLRGTKLCYKTDAQGRM